jgi:hypothetical protein
VKSSRGEIGKGSAARRLAFLSTIREESNECSAYDIGDFRLGSVHVLAVLPKETVTRSR